MSWRTPRTSTCASPAIPSRRRRRCGADPSNDLALLKVDVDRDLVPVTFADQSAIRIGDQVMAIGFALDLDGDPTVTTGIVTDRTHAADR